MNYTIKINGEKYTVNVQKVVGSTAHLTINGMEFEAEVEGLQVNPTRTSEQPTKASQPDAPVIAPAKPIALISESEQRSPLPGVIVEICVKVGDRVKAGDVLVIIEAMKMENNIEAEREGIIEKINCQKGEPVAEGDVLFILKQ